MSENIAQGRVVVNAFVTRQTKNSPFSYYDGSIHDVARMAETALASGRSTMGYRDGVLLVPADPSGFYCGVVEVTEESRLVATFEARKEGEEKHVIVRATGTKLPAEVVELVLYRRDVLEENERSPAILNSADPAQVRYAGWELISINARPTMAPEPMHPLAMARNFLGKGGGTPATYTAEEFAKAIWYWSKRAMVNSVG